MVNCLDSSQNNALKPNFLFFLSFFLSISSSLTVGCIDVFGQCLMFDEVKEVLDKCGHTGSYPGICIKVF